MFSWNTLLAVYAVNALYVGIMYLLQVVDKSLPERGSFIPHTSQSFLHMQDWHTMIYGDLVALPLVANAFVQLAMSDFIGLWQWVIFAIIYVVASAGCLLVCLGKNHKPDQGFPEVGRISWHGISHLPYFGVYVAMSAIVVFYAFLGNIEVATLIFALFGGGLYIVTFVADMRAGYFAPLRLEKS